jgi:CRISPR-associated protein Csm1
LPELLKERPSYEPCKVCHRDDTTYLDELSNEEDSVLACPTCREMYWLGERLFDTKFLLRSQQLQELSNVLVLQSSSYQLFKSQPQEIREDETLLVINDWSLGKYHHIKTIPLLLGCYGQKVEDEQNKNERFIRALEMAEGATGIKRVGYLRMDVDRLGQIFAEGLGEHYSLPKLAGLSRQMSYFFKVYLNTLAKTRQLPESAQKLTESDRPNLLFIYAGGDDLFVSGAWNEVVEFAFDVYQSFRAYTGNNPDITLSGGISIDDIKFPLYQSAESSGKAEDLAKGNGRDSLGLFGTSFKWKQWLGATDPQTVEELINELDDKAKNHLDTKDKPDWLGIFPFVRSLPTELTRDYSRSFVRNLLITAELQEQAIKEKQKKIDEIKKKQPATQDNLEVAKLEHEQEEIRYYLHLPKIAYTLARLPNRLRKEDSSFKSVRTSLKSPYNAPYFRAIATWIELLTRNTSGS